MRLRAPFSVPLALVAGLGSGCMPAGQYPLETMAPTFSDPGVIMAVEALATFERHEGWSMVMDLEARATGGRGPLVDLTRVLLRSDDTEWRSCKLPPGSRPEDLQVRLDERGRATLRLRCVELRRPEESLEVRIPVSGTGGVGFVDVVLKGVRDQAL